ncbi:hypothetical protein MTR67_019147 [Solanum verrucosum]|uniref:Reverse transcriptase zinc-binding domain-containing protein n=1 Tax=Solanum verrucosum TaxID=315347 RepID=A0AAF0TM63_SOLVR|nr:hypothetical protein MTR67_019147 [Solanum verrucosum]
MPSSTLMMLSSWKSIGRQGGDENRWQVLPASIWLTVSKERNSRFFEEYRSKGLHTDTECSKEEKYMVKDNYCLMSSQNELLDNWPWKHVWKIRTPPKVTHFTWLALNDAVLTHDNLCKKKKVLHTSGTASPICLVNIGTYLGTSRKPTLVGFCGKLKKRSRRSGD